MLQVLVADSDPLVRETLALGLEAYCAARVVRCGTGAAAIEAMQRQRLDAAVLEADLPDISGFAVADRAGTMNIPVLLIPGRPDHALICRDYGYPCLLKPLLPTTLAEETLGIIRRAKENIDRVQASGEMLKQTFADLTEAIQTARRSTAESAAMRTIRVAKIGRDPFR